MQNILRQ